MRSKCRLAILVTMLAAVLALPAGASAQIEQFSLSPEVQLGPEGASATTTVRVQCAEGLDAFLEVNVVQNTAGDWQAVLAAARSFARESRRF